MKITTQDGTIEGTPAECAEFLRIREDAKKDRRPVQPAADEKQAKTMGDYLRELEEQSSTVTTQPWAPSLLTIT